MGTQSAVTAGSSAAEPADDGAGSARSGAALPLFILAFDHRSVLNRLFAGDGQLNPAQAREMKAIVVDAALQAAGHIRALAGGRPGILMDAETGGANFGRIRAAGIMISTPIERSGADTFLLDQGEGFLDELSETRPDHAKALVFLNPQAGPEYHDQIRRLSDALRRAAAAGHQTMLEIVVPPTRPQLAAVGGDDLRFDREIRPGLVCATIADCYRAGMQPDLWKLEGLETAADYAATADTIRSFSPQARSIVLGRGADDSRVDRWLTLAAVTPGFSGFAIGRSIWHDGLRQWAAGHCDRGEAVAQIAGRYRRFADIYHLAAAAGAPSRVAS